MINKSVYDNIQIGDVVQYDGDDMAVIKNPDHFRSVISIRSVQRVVIKSNLFCQTCIVNVTCDKHKYMLWCCQDVLLNLYPCDAERIKDWVNRLYR